MQSFGSEQEELPKLRCGLSAMSFARFPRHDNGIALMFLVPVCLRVLQANRILLVARPGTRREVGERTLEGNVRSRTRARNAGNFTLACSATDGRELQYPFLMECEERKRLEGIYLAAVAANNEAARIVADMRSEAWREATKDTRAACEEALADLSAHRKEHGC